MSKFICLCNEFLCIQFMCSLPYIVCQFRNAGGDYFLRWDFKNAGGSSVDLVRKINTKSYTFFLKIPT